MSGYSKTYKTPFGHCVITFNNNTVCGLKFADSDSNDTVVEDPEFIAKIFSQDNSKIPIQFEGTDFQIKVWNAIKKIPFGQTATYSDIAKVINHPKAVRAVGTATGSNKIAFIIPCHRVVSKNSKTYKYRWGGYIKKALLEWEQNILDTESNLI